MLSIDILSVNPQIVSDLIEKTKEFHAKEEVTFGEQMPETEYEYDWAQILADHQDDLTYLEIKNVIDALTVEKKLDLLTLMYLGRGDFDDWESARQSAQNNLPDNLPDYLLGHPFLAEYLQRSLDLIGYARE
ncbi:MULTISPECIES: DUF3775 domain-containing protein [Legionella]|uniref:DUF3775 domain-containing protein n=1 Tax=Legionella septentrionalis TaxID=2498109 RepID=A0A433JJ39_9GAMM|nr:MULTISPECIES: DUF3775 domain-containing protein [Legionella]MCP0913717.1 DUF3775 domain-containing protein [Legionella sp. 27cVA30]RUQ85418.1 DUF3775 domain-containing protein [Legionella septentrionalis]RUQ99332.1 DUF3775 domain-containing protein [Legionella septentrionalis]RUR09615.1 DUF3775 domain-containing protein [Legionella septentrionalis]RUR14809.1 DUF3775 domain-containing protein [Legionella septentrionalis]